MKFEGQGSVPRFVFGLPKWSPRDSEIRASGAETSASDQEMHVEKLCRAEASVCSWNRGEASVCLFGRGEVDTFYPLFSMHFDSGGSLRLLFEAGRIGARSVSGRILRLLFESGRSLRLLFRSGRSRKKLYDFQCLSIRGEASTCSSTRGEASGCRANRDEINTYPF